jgi:hypothetical protein
MIYDYPRDPAGLRWDDHYLMADPIAAIVLSKRVHRGCGRRARGSREGKSMRLRASCERRMDGGQQPRQPALLDLHDGSADADVQRSDDGEVSSESEERQAWNTRLSAGLSTTPPSTAAQKRANCD